VASRKNEIAELERKIGDFKKLYEDCEADVLLRGCASEVFDRFDQEIKYAGAGSALAKELKQKQEAFAEYVRVVLLRRAAPLLQERYNNYKRTHH
jgi:hypothetical protein